VKAKGYVEGFDLRNIGLILNRQETTPDSVIPVFCGIGEYADTLTPPTKFR